ncbi:hypothetical protein [Streptomyces roseolilacinus]|uniref:Membrane protein n=1 Tax=Streptomyces roseolilacinus TaxID=66904 RepID=A0A918B1Y9_9ACTN|nr:hypothetical protein [Streptomyces roseolilacinus]GGQ17015.1 membrane protein [Streptomyces roseolilacinus]
MSETETSTNEKPGRRRPPLAVALVAAAVLAAGGGTYLAVAQPGGGGVDTASRTGVPADGRGGGPALSPSPGGTAPGIAPGEPDPSGGERYRVAGALPKAPGTAYAYREQGKVTAADAARLAKALGFAGTPVKGPIGWRVGPQQDGSGPTLTVYETGDWRYEARGLTTDDCPKGKRCEAEPTDRPVSDEAARRAAAPLVEALGLTGAEVTTSTQGPLRLVTADPRVGGLPTRLWETVFTVDAGGGVAVAEGRLATLVRGDAYPVISAEQAVRELNATVRADWPRGGTGGCASPVPLDGAGAQTTDRTGADPSGPCEPRTDLPKPAKEPVTTIRTAVLGLSASAGRTGAALVPSWLFEGERDGRAHRFSYPAVPLERLFPEAGSSQLHVEPYTPRDLRLRVSFTGGACNPYLVRVQETATQVRLRLFEIPGGPRVMCPAIALPVDATVTLAEPVGDRAVVDAVTGRQVPRGRAAG